MITVVIQCETPGCKARHVVDWAESYQEARRSASRLGWYATAAADYCPEHANLEGGRVTR